MQSATVIRLATFSIKRENTSNTQTHTSITDTDSTDNWLLLPTEIKQA